MNGGTFGGIRQQDRNCLREGLSAVRAQAKFGWRAALVGLPHVRCHAPQGRLSKGAGNEAQQLGHVLLRGVFCARGITAIARELGSLAFRDKNREGPGR
jgi:hypothetical protein